MENIKDSLYQVIGVPLGATFEDIKAACLRLGETYHPERDPGDADAARTFKTIEDAYAVLSDPAKRAAYDQELAAAQYTPVIDPNLPSGRGVANANTKQVAVAPTPFMRAKRPIVAAGSVGALVILAIFSWNYLVLQAPLSSSLSADPRNEGIVARAHFGSYVQPHVVIFDLRSVASEKSPIDVFRAFLQFSQALKHREFDRVVLAHRGESKFLLEGAYFRQLGNEYADQNPVYTVRTFPEHLNRMDGKSAYGQWTGGFLGVLKGQMENFTKFHRQWYIDDLANMSTQK